MSSFVFENHEISVLITKRVLLDAFSRRHEAQKIYLRQGAAQRWISYRDHVLQGERPHSGHTDQLNACDAQLRAVSILLDFFLLILYSELFPHFYILLRTNR